MSEKNIQQFENQEFINIESFRKDGSGKKTPVWVLKDGNVLYIQTGANSYKLKRMKHTPHVRVAPCKVDGTVIGEWVNGEAFIPLGAEERRLDQLYHEKYDAEIAKLTDPEMLADMETNISWAIRL